MLFSLTVSSARIVARGTSNDVDSDLTGRVYEIARLLIP